MMATCTQRVPACVSEPERGCAWKGQSYILLNIGAHASALVQCRTTSGAPLYNPSSMLLNKIAFLGTTYN